MRDRPSRTVTWLFVALAALAGSPGRVAAQESYAVRTLVKKLEKQKEQFAQTERRARDAFVGYFDRVAEMVRKAPGLSSEQKAAKLKIIADEKASYTATGALPRSPEMFEALFVFQDALHRAREPLARTYQQLMSQALKEREDGFLQEVAKGKTRFDESTPGRGSFQTGSQWHGSRYSWDNTMRSRMRVGRLEGNAFRGHVWQGDYPEDEFVVEGTLDGNLIRFEIVEMMRGAKRFLRYQGYVVGDRMVLRVSGINTKGKPISDFVQFHRG